MIVNEFSEGTETFSDARQLAGTVVGGTSSALQMIAMIGVSSIILQGIVSLTGLSLFTCSTIIFGSGLLLLPIMFKLKFGKWLPDLDDIQQALMQ